MATNKKWEPYDPSALVELAREQHPEEVWLPDALAACSRGRRESEAYIHFVDPDSSGWRFDRNLQLESPSDGLIVLDILTNHRIGGVEFVDKL
jgi:hypothetical protein